MERSTTILQYIGAGEWKCIDDLTSTILRLVEEGFTDLGNQRGLQWNHPFVEAPNEISSEERLRTLIKIDNEVLQRAERLRKLWVEQKKAT